MAITDQARNQLYNRLREVLGDEDAGSMMELLPPMGWADVARRSDLEQLEKRLDVRFDSLERRMDQMSRFIAWSTASNAFVIAAVTLIVTVAR